jgi:molybdate transport system substrate-binding protein
MIHKIIFFILLISNFLYAKTINIAVAANVSYAIDEIKSEFNKLYPNIKVNITLGSTGKLTAQISHGAPYDMLMGANMMYPQALYKNKIAITKPVVYAQGGLAYFSIKNIDFSNGIDFLKNDNIKKIAIANPKTAPYGKAAIQSMKSANIYSDIRSKLIFAESISQAVSYAITSVDIGIIAKSSLYSQKMKKYKKDINWKEVNPKLYTPINQGIVILKNSNNSKEINDFYNFILSNQAQEIFKKYGYLIP